ncbi:MAG: hypothetical protein KJO64_03590, partial [Bacteroidia bacterium]|nr:hypothetical protein [Bacteroidia bacterium]
MMRKITLFFIACVFNAWCVSAQTVFFSEDFGTGCSTASLATSFGWTVSNTGTNDPGANRWYVSATENGNAVGACGSQCGSNRTLHLGANFFTIDGGASYYESTPFFCPGFFPCSETNKRIESPVINCAGYSSITLDFQYLENGEANDDQATLHYFDGNNWLFLHNLNKTSGICSPLGTWSAFSINLPPSADNNPYVKIGINWTNDADGLGSDPSFAIDNIQLSALTPLPVELLYFKGNQNNNQIALNWETATEINNDYFIVERSDDGSTFYPITKVEGFGNSSTNIHYEFIDKIIKQSYYYYRLKQVDFNGTFDYSDVILIKFIFKNPDQGILIPNPTTGITTLQFQSELNDEHTIVLYNQLSQQLKLTSYRAYN